MATATKSINLAEVRLSIGEEVWGYTASPVTVLNTEWQEATTITRTATYEYKISCGGRADGTGWEEYCGTFKKALAIAGFNPKSVVVNGKIQTGLR